MDKAMLMDEVAKRAKIEKPLAGRTVEAFLEAVVEALAEGEAVELEGFGKFRVEPGYLTVGESAEEQERVEFPAARKLHFEPEKRLEKAIR